MWKIKNLFYQIDDFRLQIQDLQSAASKRVTCIIGPSGAGKTTLFRILTGQIYVERWGWEVDGQDMNTLSLSEKRLGVVLQDFDLFPHLTVEENILIILRARLKMNSELLIEIEKFKGVLKLNSCWTTKAENISGGERQRVSLLRALVSQSRILLLDEPFSSLDENHRKEARQFVLDALKMTNIPVILITHDREDCLYFDAHVVEIENGQIKS